MRACPQCGSFIKSMHDEGITHANQPVGGILSKKK
jgi:hypothetical protein